MRRQSGREHDPSNGQPRQITVKSSGRRLPPITVMRKTKIRAEVAHEAAHFPSSSVFMYCPITRRI
jgi:hypothetical protein